MHEINKPIKVLVHFKTDLYNKDDKYTYGHNINNIEPLKFTIEDESEELQEIKIEGIIRRDVEDYTGEVIYKYWCNIIMHDRKRSCEIWFKVKDMIWTLHKI